MHLKIHHVSLPTSDMADASRFWRDVLGMEAHPKKPNWFGWSGSDYPIHLMPSHGENSCRVLHDYTQHFALEVDDLEIITNVLLDAGLEPFQASLVGEKCPIKSLNQPLDFGIGTVFQFDLDKNLIEFVQRGRGIMSLI